MNGLVPATVGENGGVLDIQQLLWEFPGKLRLVPLGKKTFLAKFRNRTKIDMGEVRERLNILSRRTEEERFTEYARVKKCYLEFVEALLKEGEPRRIERDIAYSQLFSRIQESSMSTGEREYREFLMLEIQTAQGERKLCIQREIDRLQRDGWDIRSACERCGNPIPVEKLKRHLRTGVCYPCQK